MNIPDHISESLDFFGFKIHLNLLVRSGIRNLFDPGSGMEEFGSCIRDGKIRIRDPE